MYKRTGSASRSPNDRAEEAGERFNRTYKPPSGSGSRSPNTRVKTD